MTPLFIYFIKVNLALALLYISYRLLFRNDTFFGLRRITLLGMLLIAFLYQLPDISSWLSTRPTISEVVSYYSTILPKEMTTEAITNPDKIAYEVNMDWGKAGMTGLIIVYLMGVLLLTIRSIAEIINLFITYRQSRKSKINGVKVCLIPETEEPYSFFRWIFIPAKKQSKLMLAEILQHETAHTRQIHSFDVLVGEFVSIICWINPFAWFFKKEIGLNLEYMADQEVMYAGYNKKEYQYHLIGMEHSNTAIANLYNNFSVLPLKKRITMLNKKRTNGVGKVKYLALVPMAAAMLLFNNIDVMARIVNNQTTEAPKAAAVVTTPEIVQTVIEEAPLPPDDDKVYTVCDVMPEFPGGQDKLLQYLASSIKYPAESIEKKEEGRVTLTYIVEKDGSISNIEVVRSVSPSLDAEALRVIKSMPKWTPAKNKGKIVRVSYTVPVTFRLK